MSIDFEKASHLLQIAEKALSFGNRFRFLHDAALGELEAMEDKPKEEPKEMPPIEKQMRGETASTFRQFGEGKDADK